MPGSGGGGRRIACGERAFDATGKGAFALPASPRTAPSIFSLLESRGTRFRPRAGDSRPSGRKPGYGKCGEMRGQTRAGRGCPKRPFSGGRGNAPLDWKTTPPVPRQGLVDSPNRERSPSFRRKPESIFMPFAFRPGSRASAGNETPPRIHPRPQMDSGFRRNDDQNRIRP